MPYLDPERKRKNAREYREANREVLARKQMERYFADPKGHAAKSKEYYKRRPEIQRAAMFAQRSNERARALGTMEKLRGGDVRKVVGPCAYCGSVCTGWDHVVPLSRGGANHVSNLVPCCRSCNARKGFKLVDEWKDPERVKLAHEHDEYCRSGWWRRRRRMYWSTHRHVCLGCGESNPRRVHLHHLTYDNIGAEPDEDLMPLCCLCHNQVHVKERISNLTIREATTLVVGLVHAARFYVH